ncbi:MAG: hypothetical protein WC222_01605 [Parachlamydiales bacterium]|jgi:hypothetical protein
MSLSEKAIQFQEEHIPELAQAAIVKAYWEALAVGSSVIECRDGVLIEIFPDGSHRVIRKLTPSFKISIGQRIER